MVQTKRKRAIIRQGTIDEVRSVRHLLEAHWRELCTDTDLMQLDPDWRGYYELEERGRTFVLTASMGDEIVGYSLNLFGPHLHYRHLIVAQNDVLYLTPAARRGGCGLRLIRATEQVAKQRGAHVMSWHAKERPPQLQLLLQRLGYDVQDIYFTRRL